jgi:hypothetical protein
MAERTSASRFHLSSHDTSFHRTTKMRATFALSLAALVAATLATPAPAPNACVIECDLDGNNCHQVRLFLLQSTEAQQAYGDVSIRSAQGEASAPRRPASWSATRTGTTATSCAQAGAARASAPASSPSPPAPRASGCATRTGRTATLSVRANMVASAPRA